MSKRFCCTNCGKSFAKPVGLHKHLVSSITTTHCIQYYMAASKLGPKAIQTMSPKAGQQLFLAHQQMKAIVQGLLPNYAQNEVFLDKNTASKEPSDNESALPAYLVDSDIESVNLDIMSEIPPNPNSNYNYSGDEESSTLGNALPVPGITGTGDNYGITQPGIHLMTNSQKHEIKLLQLLQNLNAPNYAYAQIMSWARMAFISGYDFSPQHKDYNGQIRYLERWLQSAQHLRPVKRNVLLRFDNHPIPVVTFNFTAQLLSLFQDKTLNQMENLVVNATDPFRRYTPPTGRLGEINSGEHYAIAYENMVLDPAKDFLCPIIMYIDETTVSMQSQISCHPVMFTSTLFNRHTRNKSSSWRVLGYIPNTSYYYSNIISRKKFKGCQKSFRYNQLLDAILESFVSAQQPGALDNVLLPLGPFEKLVNLKVPLFFIIGDIQGGDKIAGRFNSHSIKAKRISRTCNAGPEHYGNLSVDCCQPLVMNDVRQLYLDGNYKAMEDMYQHPHDLAFFHVDYGGEPGGIFTAAMPIEGLHCLENGIISHCLHQLFSDDDCLLLPKGRQELDEVVSSWAKSIPRQRLLQGGYGNDLPRLRFQEGITCLSNTSAAHKVGAMLATVLACLTSEGRNTFYSRSRQQDKQSGEQLTLDMLYIFEMLLCFWAWLKKEDYWHCGDEKSLADAKEAIATLLSETAIHFDRSSGQGWSIPKFHELLHIANNIRLWGSHQNIHSGPQEHNHIANIKQPARRTQKIKTKFDFQVATRVYERNLTNHVSALVNDSIPDSKDHVLKSSTQHDTSSLNADSCSLSPHEATNQASKYVVTFVRHLDGTVHYNCYWTSPSNDSISLSLELVNALKSSFFDILPLNEQRRGIKLKGYTEYNRNGIVFRAHPNYRAEGPWYDYAMVTWKMDASDDSSSSSSLDTNSDDLGVTQPGHMDKTCIVPAKIIGFVTAMDDSNLLVIIHSCYEQKKKESVLTNRWRLEFEEDKLPVGGCIFPDNRLHDDASHKTPLIRQVEVDCLERHCLMIPYHLKSHFLLELIPQHEWANEFSEV